MSNYYEGLGNPNNIAGIKYGLPSGDKLYLDIDNDKLYLYSTTHRRWVDAPNPNGDNKAPGGNNVEVTFTKTLYIAIDGQSNAIGQQANSTIPVLELNNIKVWDGFDWVFPTLGEAPFNPNGADNMGLRFVEKLALENPNIDYKLICSGTNGQPISFWVDSPNTGHTDLQTQLAAAGVTTLDTLIWMQGESDLNNNDYLNDYYALLDLMYSTPYITERTKILNVGLYTGVGAAFPQKDTELRAISHDSNQFTNYVNTESCEVYDNIHYTNNEMYRLGHDLIYSTYLNTPYTREKDSKIPNSIYYINGGISSYDKRVSKKGFENQPFKSLEDVYADSDFEPGDRIVFQKGTYALPNISEDCTLIFLDGANLTTAVSLASVFYITALNVVIETPINFQSLYAWLFRLDGDGQNLIVNAKEINASLINVSAAKNYNIIINADKVSSKNAAFGSGFLYVGQGATAALVNTKRNKLTINVNEADLNAFGSLTNQKELDLVVNIENLYSENSTQSAFGYMQMLNTSENCNYVFNVNNFVLHNFTFPYNTGAFAYGAISDVFTLNNSSVIFNFNSVSLSCLTSGGANSPSSYLSGLFSFANMVLNNSLFKINIKNLKETNIKILGINQATLTNSNIELNVNGKGNTILTILNSINTNISSLVKVKSNYDSTAEYVASIVGGSGKNILFHDCQFKTSDMVISTNRTLSIINSVLVSEAYDVAIENNGAPALLITINNVVINADISTDFTYSSPMVIDSSLEL